MPTLDHPGYGRERLVSPDSIEAFVPEADALNGLITPGFRMMVANEGDSEVRQGMFTQIDAVRHSLMAGMSRNGLSYPDNSVRYDHLQVAAAWNQERGLPAGDPSFANLASYDIAQLPEGSVVVDSAITGYHPSLYGGFIQMGWHSRYPARGFHDRGMGNVIHDFMGSPNRYVDVNGEWRTTESLLTPRQKIVRSLGRMADRASDALYAAELWLGDVVENPRKLIGHRKLRAMGGIGIDGATQDEK